MERLKQFSKGKIKMGNHCNILIHESRSNVSFGKNLDIRNYCNILVGKNAELSIGDSFFMNNYCSINCLQKIEIGNSTIFGEGVKLYDHNHTYSKNGVNTNEFTFEPIVIGNHCWLGSNVTVLKGVTIGDNCIIGAGSVVYKDIPNNSVVINKADLTIKPIS